MLPDFRPLLIFLCIAAAAAPGLSQQISPDDVARIECSLDGKSTFYTWTGTIFSFQPQQPQQQLFGFVGFSVARCIKDSKGNFQQLSREISYYLDPDTNERLTTWRNPLNNATVTVVHVSNDPVNNPVSGPFPLVDVGGSAQALSFDVPLIYPNPLHGNSSFAQYGGSFPMYQGGEFFKFYFDSRDLAPKPVKVDNVSISWTRVGPFLPFMKMGPADGYLFYSCQGARAADLSHLPAWLVKDVQARLPLYLEAPTQVTPSLGVPLRHLLPCSVKPPRICFCSLPHHALQDESPNETSWTYFKRHFDAYLRGDEFPLPAPAPAPSAAA